MRKLYEKKSWHGRMRACRGVGSAMDETQIHAWNEEHLRMLNENAPERFHVKHYVSIAELQVRKMAVHSPVYSGEDGTGDVVPDGKHGSRNRRHGHIRKGA